MIVSRFPAVQTYRGWMRSRSEVEFHQARPTHYWRALYNEERDAYVVEAAGWVDDESQIEYRFAYFSDEEDEEIAGLGGLDKWWLNDDGFAEGEFFAFRQVY